MALTENCSAKVLKNLLGKETNGIIDECYIGLSTTTPNTGGGNFSEPVGGGYERALLGDGRSTPSQIMSDPVGGESHNNSIIFFPEATSAWGTVTHFGLFDAKTGGNLMVYGALTASVAVVANKVPLFRVNAFSMSIS